MSCSASAQAPSNVQSPTSKLTPVQQQVPVGTLLGNLDTTEQVYYYVTNDGPVLAGVNNIIPDDVDWDENVLSSFKRLGINGLGSTLCSSAAELPADARLLEQMYPSLTIIWTLFQMPTMQTASVMCILTSTITVIVRLRATLAIKRHLTDCALILPTIRASGRDYRVRWRNRRTSR
jgi:hypothetical protein